MRLFPTIVLVLLLAGGTGSLAAQAPSNGASAPAGGGAGAPRPQMMQPQGPAGQIRGTIQDQGTGQPLGAASVAVWSAADSSLVTGAITNADGRFRIEGLRPGAYYVKVTFVGYKVQTIDKVAVQPSAPLADLGVIRLATNPVALEAVEVNAQRGAVQLTVDRTVYNAKDMPAAAGGTAVDVLRNVPAVEVDADGKVSLRGNQNIAVQINGRPAPVKGDALQNFLQQLPASMVERVEVVPNPSAKYDPEGMGGILNIVLKQNAELGLSGGLTLGLGTGNWRRNNASGNLGYQKGALTLFGSYGFNSDKRHNSGFNFRENRYLSPLTYLEQESDGTNAFRGHVLNGNADLKLSKRDVLSSSLMLNFRRGAFDNTNSYRTLDATRTEIDRFDRLTDAGMHGVVTDMTLAFKRTLQPQKHELSTELRFNRTWDDGDSRYTLVADNLSPATAALETNHTEPSSRDLSLQLDYTHPLGEGLKLETGYKGSLRQIENAFAAEYFASDGNPLAGRSRDNDFVYDEDVHAGYGIVTKDFGRIDVQAGARVERVFTNFDLTTTGETFENDYTSIFPSGSVLFEMSDKQQLKASYSKRIQRPDTRLLNPFAMAEDPLNLFVGNPHLKPEYTHSFELGFQRFIEGGSLQLTPYYRRTVDAVRRFKTVDTLGVSTTSFRNMATAESYGADLTGSMRLGTRLNGFGTLSAFRMVTDGSNVASNLGSEAVVWSARMSLSYKVTPSMDISWMQFYRAPMTVEQGKMGAFQMSNVAVRQKLFGDKASVSLRVSDPLDRMRFSFQTADANHYQESTRRWDSRVAYLSFSYNFGQAPRLNRRNQPQDQQQQPDIGIQ